MFRCLLIGGGIILGGPFREADAISYSMTRIKTVDMTGASLNACMRRGSRNTGDADSALLPAWPTDKGC
jgi:hypothetical protein